MALINLVVHPSQQMAGWIAQALSPLLQPLIQKELDSMSATVTEAVANLNAATQDLETKAQAYVAAKQADDATITSLQSQLASAQAGDPSVVTAIDAATAAVGQVSATLTPPATPEGEQPPV